MFNENIILFGNQFDWLIYIYIIILIFITIYVTKQLNMDKKIRKEKLSYTHYYKTQNNGLSILEVHKSYMMKRIIIISIAEENVGVEY